MLHHNMLQYTCNKHRGLYVLIYMNKNVGAVPELKILTWLAVHVVKHGP